MIRERAAKEQAFTLLEVLIAMLIFSIGTLGVLALVTTSITLNGQSRYFGEASVLGQWKLDELLTAPAPATSTLYTGCPGGGPRSSWCKATGPAPVGSTTGPATVTLSDVEGTNTSNTRYQLAWGTTAMVAPNVGLYAITVDVYWPRDKNKVGLAVGAPGFVDCTTNSGVCYSLEFHAYRR